MDEEKTKISLSLKDGSLEVSGSEAFVRETLKSFDVEIRSALSRFKTLKASNLKDNDRDADLSEEEPEHDNDSTLDGIAELNGEEVILIYEPLKESASANTQDAAVLYLYAREVLKNDKTPIATGSIRKVCQDLGCLDEGNFMTHLKAAKPNIVLMGQKKSQTIKLTTAGRKQAKVLIKEVFDAAGS